MTESTLDRLADATSDLARTQASSAVVDATQSKSLDEIQRRLELIERRIGDAK